MSISKRCWDGRSVTFPHGLINYKGTKDKCCHLKKKPVKGIDAGVYLSKAYSPPRFFLGGLAIL